MKEYRFVCFKYFRPKVTRPTIFISGGLKFKNYYSLFFLNPDIIQCVLLVGLLVNNAEPDCKSSGLVRPFQV